VVEAQYSVALAGYPKAEYPAYLPVVVQQEVVQQVVYLMVGYQGQA
jgi:hypothetical protein